MSFCLKVELTVGLTTKLGAPVPKDIALACIVQRLADANIDGFSVLQQTGFWQGAVEESLLVTVLCDKDEGQHEIDFCHIGRLLADDLLQDCVLVCHTEVNAGLVWSEEPSLIEVPHFSGLVKP